MLAIHNSNVQELIVFQVANAFAKLSKCQQFTTNIVQISCILLLQTLMQSYQNVSNSQHVIKFGEIKISCKRFCKVIKMLAIHNSIAKVSSPFSVANAFAKLSKCQQFTTYWNSPVYDTVLQTLLQSYQNVSNSQQKSTATLFPSRCKRLCKVIKMLAIHNDISTAIKKSCVANAYAKLSKCQQFTT